MTSYERTSLEDALHDTHIFFLLPLMGLSSRLRLSLIFTSNIHFNFEELVVMTAVVI